ncbi:MAG TPA: ATP-binding cassette domain-containing protein [Stellaceae bacterium]|nr:ATP-binding cassette domain-containing protein [Stellaceae bacterium]
MDHILTTIAADPIRLTGSPAPVRLLEAGTAQIFVVREADDGAAVERWRHIATMTAPCLLPPAVPAWAGLRFVVEPDSGGKISEFESAAFWRAAASPTEGALALPAAAALVVALGGGVARLFKIRPSRQRPAANGGVSLSAGETLDTARQMFWYRIARGNLQVLGGAETAQFGVELLPFPPGVWVTAVEHTELRAVDLADLIAGGELSRILDVYTHFCLAVADTGLKMLSQAETRRVRARTARLDTERNRIVNDLLALSGVTPEDTAAPDANQTLLTAVHAVARQIGVKARLPTSIREATAGTEASLDAILRASALLGRRVALTDGWWQGDLGGGLIGFRGQTGAPVALLASRGGLILVDPSDGSRRPVDAAVAGTLQNEAVFLYRPLPDTKLGLRELLLFGHWDSLRDLIGFLVSVVAGGLIGMAPPMATEILFGLLVPGHFGTLIWHVGAVLAVLALLGGIFAYAGSISSLRVRQRLMVRLKAALWERVLRMPMPAIANYAAADFTGRVIALEGLHGAVFGIVQGSLRTLGMLIGNFAMMFWYSPMAALAALGLLLLLALVTLLAAFLQDQAFKGGERSLGLVTSFALELALGVAHIRAAGAEDRAFIGWADRFSRLRAKLIRSREVANGFNAFAGAFTTIATAIVFLVVAAMSSEPMAIGGFMGFIAAFSTAVSMSVGLAQSWLQLSFQLSMAPYSRPILDQVPERPATKSSPGTLSGRVEVSNLVFRYPNELEAVLSGVSFKVEAGEFVAIVGPTGSGKSTLLRLLLGLETPQAGAVIYDGSDLRGLDAQEVRRQIGVVMQRIRLTAGTIFENIRGTTDATRSAVWDAVRLAGIENEIAALPMGLDTVVTDGGRNFSGGQVQRLAIARAIVKHPALLLFDEATSALDNHAQAQVAENLADLAATRIVIAHRLSTIKRADRIVVLNKGRVAETGTYAELIAKNGLFAQLALRQLT